MSSSLKKLEIASHVAVITASLLLCFVLVSGFVGRPKADTAKSALAKIPNEPLTITGVDWSKSKKTVVLAISSHCPYCLRSTDFYHNLSEAEVSAKPKARIIALLPESEASARQFLDKHQVRVDQIADPGNASIHVEATPTVFIVDDHGKVTNEWVGKLSPGEEKQVMNSLLN